MELPTTKEIVNTNSHPQEWYTMQFDFSRTVSDRTGISIEEIIKNYTALHGLFSLKGSGIYPDFIRAINYNDDKQALILATYVDPSYPYTRCSSFDYPDFSEDGKTIRVHFSNAERGEISPLAPENQRKRFIELKQIFSYIKSYCGGEYVLGRSWLYNLSSYRAIYPPEFTENLSTLGLNTDTNTDAFWGQFLNKYGNINIGRYNLFKHNLLHLPQNPTTQQILAVLPFQIMECRCHISHFYQHYGVIKIH